MVDWWGLGVLGCFSAGTWDGTAEARDTATATVAALQQQLQQEAQQLADAVEAAQACETANAGELMESRPERPAELSLRRANELLGKQGQ